MREVNAAFAGTDDVGQVVIQIRAERTGAERDAVVGIVNRIEHLVNVFLVRDDARQIKHRPCGVVGMDRHFDAVLFAGRHDGFQEIHQVIEQLVCGDILVRFKQLLDVCKTFGFPAGHDETVGVGIGLVKEHLRVDGIDDGLVVGKHSGTVVARLCKVRARPVKDGHEVVAYHVDALVTEVFQGLDVVFDVLIARRQTDLDVVVDVDGLNAGNFQILRFHLRFQRGNFFSRPQLACLAVV